MLSVVLAILLGLSVIANLILLGLWSRVKEEIETDSDKNEPPDVRQLEDLGGEGESSIEEGTPREENLSRLVNSLTLLVLWLSREDRGETVLRSDRPLDASQIEQDIAELVGGSDPLGNLAKFMYWQRRGQASADDGYIAANVLFQKLEYTWGLKPFGRFQQVTFFDPKQHRLHPRQDLSPGTLVCVIEPGWVMADRIIKYPLVVKKD
jgi:hypothetical protein